MLSRQGVRTQADKQALVADLCHGGVTRSGRGSGAPTLQDLWGATPSGPALPRAPTCPFSNRSQSPSQEHTKGTSVSFCMDAARKGRCVNPQHGRGLCCNRVEAQPSHWISGSNPSSATKAGSSEPIRSQHEILSTQGQGSSRATTQRGPGGWVGLEQGLAVGTAGACPPTVSNWRNV